MSFKDVPGYGGRYQVNDKGEVKSLGWDCVVRNVKRRNRDKRSDEVWHRKTKLLKQIRIHDKKPFVHLHDKEGKRTNFYIAQLVLMCFVTDGELIPIRKIKYRDGDIHNCCIDNLYYESL